MALSFSVLSRRPLRSPILVRPFSSGRTRFNKTSDHNDCDTDMPKTAYYAVKAGRRPGIYHTWAEAEAQVKGFGGAKFKKFPTQGAADAFMNGGRPYDLTPAESSTAESRSGTSSSIKSRSNTKTTQSARTKSKREESPPTTAQTSALPPNLLEIAAKGYSFSRASPHRLVVYTDGSGIGNGKAGAVAGAGVFWGGTGEAAKNNLAERVPGDVQTNNRGELLSIIRAMEECPYPDMPLEIRTDSQYSINCMTVYIHKWIRNGWRTGSAGDAVKNADMIRHLLVLLRRRSPAAPVRFKYVRGHAGHEGNEAADKLARLGAMSPPLPDRNDWLQLDSDASGNEESLPEHVEIDPDWLMSDAELKEFESSLTAE